MSIENKKKHFISVIAPTGDSVVVDIYLTEDEYMLINQISTIILAEANATAPIMVISKPIEVNETLENGIVEG